MLSLRGTVLMRIVDLSQPERPRWLAKTLDDRSVFIKYDLGCLTVRFDGSEDDYVLPLKASEGNTLTTEVMLLLTGLSVLAS
ncbi:MAG: hypothetical protein FD169_1714 [Bacillota bacterium]|nr:MAG: hypothetical protein FD169_1714 [Bacillota bacterium]MBS3949856.1 hypothetical protein [Peptococcaceae bacterium]